MSTSAQQQATSDQPRPDGSTGNVAAVDALLARLVRGEAADWPARCGNSAASLAVDRAAYHGISGILAAQRHLAAGFPPPVIDAFVDRARAVAMRELRHRELLGNLIAALDQQGIEPILLKGSALAYDLYANPAWRERGDSDVLVRPDDRVKARSVLAQLGFEPIDDDGMAEDYRYQEIWSRTLEDGTVHDIDLHFAPMNMPAFAERIAYEDAARGRRPLGMLGPAAYAPSRAFLLLHACLHRKTHECAPYRLGATLHYGGDRLIWLADIDLLARAFGPGDWKSFHALAERTGEGASCRDGLQAARRWLGTPLAADRLERLGHIRSTHYFEAGAVGRAWRDVRSIRGLNRRAGYVLNRLFPNRGFMRAKYPGLSRAPLALLYLKRMADLARPRSSLPTGRP